MKTIAQLALLLFTVYSTGCSVLEAQTRFEIREAHSARSLTLGWEVPLDVLQEIVGPESRPAGKDGKGFLMLFVVSAEHYFLDDSAYNALQMAHIIIPVEGKNTINAPTSLVSKNQAIHAELKAFGFELERGSVEMKVRDQADSLTIDVQLLSRTGNIELSTTFLNNPGPVKHLDSTTVTATHNPNSFFCGPESYVPIQIPTVQIAHTGKNWLTEFGLTRPPDRVWMNDRFVWDFVFTRKGE